MHLWPCTSPRCSDFQGGTELVSTSTAFPPLCLFPRRNTSFAYSSILTQAWVKVRHICAPLRFHLSRRGDTVWKWWDVHLSHSCARLPHVLATSTLDQKSAKWIAHLIPCNEVAIRNVIMQIARDVHWLSHAEFKEFMRCLRYRIAKCIQYTVPAKSA